MNRRLANIFFWGIISAAFIGPGTVTTAAAAGAGYGYQLLWALAFSTIACIVLQEASARLCMGAGRNLGSIVHHYFGGRPYGSAAVWLILGTVIFGCAAYETGNILGAVAGGALVFDVPAALFTLVIGSVAALLLWFGSTRLIAQIMGTVVALMGICFVAAAVMLGPSLPAVGGGLWPSFPGGSEVMILGLIGTTVVPYNLFLGSGLPHKQSLSEMRWSLGIAIALGGVVSAAVLVVGTSVAAPFSFEGLAKTLQQQLGSGAHYLLGIGLLAAGFSSALTAPLAAAITAKSWDQGKGSSFWKETGIGYRLVWGAVLLTGVLFGIMDLQPVPAIILAQALNGIILPVAAVFIFGMVNNRSLLEARYQNSGWYNGLMGIIVVVTIVLGLRNVVNATGRLGIAEGLSQRTMFMLGWGTVILLFIIGGYLLYRHLSRKDTE